MSIEFKRVIWAHLLIPCLVLVIDAHAADPSARGGTPATSSSTTGISSAASAGGTQTVAPQPDTLSTAEYARQRYLKLAKSRGYKLQKRDGQTVYCRSEAPIGSRFERQSCLTEDVLVSRLKHEDEALAQASRSSPAVGSNPGQ